MRPKIVILTFVCALGIVGLMVLLKSATGTNPGGSPTANSPVPVTEASTESTPPANPVEPNATNTAAADSAHAAQLQQELDQIRELFADGISPTTRAALLSKLSHPEGEVRKAALDALVQLNDTNAIPGLEQAVASVQDPHEKVALLDAVAYLKIPSITDEAAASAAVAQANDPNGAKVQKGVTPHKGPGKRARPAVRPSQGGEPKPPANSDQNQAITPNAPQ